MEAKNLVLESLETATKTIQAAVNSNLAIVALEVAEVTIKSFENGGKLLLAGNGGSAADAQHIAAEFVNYFYYPRDALPAIALTVDTSVITSISNDTGYEKVFSRQVEALAKPGDTIWLYSTSGKSANIIRAGHTAKSKGVSVCSFVGSYTDGVVDFSEVVVSVPSSDTPRVQEVHLILGHAISQAVEQHFFSK